MHSSYGPVSKEENGVIEIITGKKRPTARLGEIARLTGGGRGNGVEAGQNLRKEDRWRIEGWTGRRKEGSALELGERKGDRPFGEKVLKARCASGQGRAETSQPGCPHLRIWTRFAGGGV